MGSGGVGWRRVDSLGVAAVSHQAAAECRSPGEKVTDPCGSSGWPWSVIRYSFDGQPFEFVNVATGVRGTRQL